MKTELSEDALSYKIQRAKEYGVNLQNRIKNKIDFKKAYKNRHF
jgi:hypothetical protein